MAMAQRNFSQTDGEVAEIVEAAGPMLISKLEVYKRFVLHKKKTFSTCFALQLVPSGAWH